MAAKSDLEKLSLEELKSLKKDVEKAIASFKGRQRAEALKEMQAVAARHGMSVDEIIGGKGQKAKSKSKAPPRYRNPADPAQTWSGRGRQPAWFKAAIAKGKKPENMEL